MKNIFKQKIAQWREYQDARTVAKKQYAEFIRYYEDWEYAKEVISVTESKANINEVLQRPDDNLFGTKEYPCIVNYTCLNPYNNTSFIRPDDFKESFPCKNYEQNSVCLKEKCLWHPDNLSAFKAWEQYQNVADEFRKAKEQYDNACRAFWGEKLFRVFSK
jgi:hypothetical protein